MNVNNMCCSLIKRIDHFDLTTNDIKASKDFYEKLGFKYCEQNNYLYGNNFIIKLHELNSNKKPLPKNVSVGSIDICFESFMLPQQIEQYLKNAGIPIFLGPVERTGYYGKMISIYVYDPSGNLLEFSNYCNCR